MADAKKGIPAVGGAGMATKAAKTGQKKKVLGNVRMHDGKVVKPFLFDGRYGGHGKYWAGYVRLDVKDSTVWDGAILDAQGVPLQFRNIGELAPAG